MKARIAVLPGDGIGPEVIAQGVRCLRALAQAGGHEFTLEELPFGGAAIDVWWQYPSPNEPNRRGSRHPFHTLPNVIVTPHNSGWTAGMVRRRWDEIADNIARFCRGDPLINLVTTV